MPRFLAIDWDPPKLNLLGVNAAKGKARVEASLAFTLTQDLTPASAATLGRQLKEALATANIAAAPVLFSLGRDRVILKELSIPFVPAHEEPTVVRFQAAKELTEAASDVVLDYARLAPAKAGQSTPVQVVIVRKSIVAAMNALCQAAGLKLQGILPRPYALTGLLDRAAAPATIPLTRGLLVPTGDDEAEFCVYSADRLVWARTLSAGPELASEVQKNLVLLSTQKSELPELQQIEVAGLAGLGKLSVPREPLEPWRESDAKPANPTPFLAALGLAEAAAKPSGLSVNLAAPKEAKPVTDNFQRRKKMGLIALAVLGPLLIVGFYVNLKQKDAKIKELTEMKEDLDSEWKKREQDRIDVASLKEWEETSISWLDQLYDLSSHMPHVQGLRVTQVAATQVPRRQTKEIYTGVITIHGAMNSDQDTLITQFLESLQKDDKYVKAQSPKFKANEFEVKIAVAPRPAGSFLTRLVVPPQVKREAITSEPKLEEPTDE